MSLTPSTGEDRFREALKGGGFSNVNRPKEGYNYYRLIDGPEAIRELWYPYLGKDDETGKEKIRFKSILSPNTGSEILKTFANLDKRLAGEVLKDDAASKYRSPFNPGNKFRYLGFDRAHNTENNKIEVVVIELPYSVVERLRKIQQEISKRDATKLRFGMLYMYDIIVQKVVDKSKPAQFGTTYITEVDTEEMPSIKIPRAIADGDMDVDELDGGLGNFFEADELKVLDDFDGDLTEMFPPNTEDEIREIIETNPPVLNAKRDSKPIFTGLNLLTDPKYQDVLERLEEFRPVMLDEVDDEESEKPKRPAKPKKKALPGVKKKAVVEEEDEEEDEIPDADVVDDEEQEEPDPPVKKTDPLKNKKKKKRLF